MINFHNRAVGLPKRQIIKISLYESISNLLGAIIIGIVIGVIASGLIAIMFMTTIEMPFTLIVRDFNPINFIDSYVKFGSYDNCVHHHNIVRKPYWGKRNHKQVNHSNIKRQ